MAIDQATDRFDGGFGGSTQGYLNFGQHQPLPWAEAGPESTLHVAGCRLHLARESHQ